MKVTINGVEIEIKGGSRLTYDAGADTLSVDPIYQEKRKYTKRSEKEKIPKKDDRDAISKIRTIPDFDEAVFSSMKPSELKQKIFDAILGNDQPVAQQFITMSCLGKGASNSARHYFSTLINQMGEEGELICDSSSGRSRWSMP